MTSLRAWLLIGWYRATRRKQIFLDTTKFERSIHDSQRSRSAHIPRSLRRRYRIERHDMRGFPCYVIRPPGGESGKRILYLHGGAYVHSIETQHWRFVGKLVDELGCVAVVPLYPLAPTYQYDKTIAAVVSVYDAFLADAAPNDQVIMGDSAGGGLSLVLARRLKSQQRARPRNIVLISPWLDISMRDPAIPSLDRRDPYLSTPGLLEAGRMYAGDLDPLDERVSPLYGDLDSLGRLSVFVGTRDVLLIDSRHLRRIARRQGVDLDYFEYSDMTHGWVLQRIPEGERATARIVELCR